MSTLKVLSNKQLVRLYRMATKMRAAKLAQAIKIEAWDRVFEVL